MNVEFKNIKFFLTKKRTNCEIKDKTNSINKVSNKKLEESKGINKKMKCLNESNESYKNESNNNQKNVDMKNSKNQYNYKKVICIPIILNHIFQFSTNDDIKSLKMCCKRICKLYYEQVTKLKLNRNIQTRNILKIKERYINLRELDLSECKKITNYSFISKFEFLEKLERV